MVHWAPAGRGSEESVNHIAALMFSFSPLISRRPRHKKQRLDEKRFVITQTKLAHQRRPDCSRPPCPGREIQSWIHACQPRKPDRHNKILPGNAVGSSTVSQRTGIQPAWSSPHMSSSHSDVIWRSFFFFLNYLRFFFVFHISAFTASSFHLKPNQPNQRNTWKSFPFFHCLVHVQKGGPQKQKTKNALCHILWWELSSASVFVPLVSQLQK